AFMAAGRTREEAAKWMEENGPRVEVRTLRDTSTVVNQKVEEANRLHHELDTKVPAWREGVRTRELMRSWTQEQKDLLAQWQAAELEASKVAGQAKSAE